MATNLNEQGGQIAKTVTVHTNDPQHAQILLKITGKVDRIVSIEPGPTITFTGTVDQPFSRTVTITPEAKYPFKVTGLSALEGYDIQYHMAEKEVEGKTVYLLTVTNVKKTPGRYFDRIYVKTDNPTVGSIPILVSGYLVSGPTPAK